MEIQWNKFPDTSPDLGGEFLVVWVLDDNDYPVTTMMNYDKPSGNWYDHSDVKRERPENKNILFWTDLPEPPQGIDEKIWKIMTTIKSYAGIGTRSATQHEEKIMAFIAVHLFVSRGYTLYSGHAEGSDMAFERGCYPQYRLWLPWPQYNNADSPDAWAENKISLEDLTKEEMEPARASVYRYHPAPNNLTTGARKMHERNYYIVMGLPSRGLPPVDFVVCNADLDLKAGGVAGGTGQAVRIAIAHKIPVYNIRTRQWIFGSHPVLDGIIKSL